MNAKAWEDMSVDERKYVQDVEKRIARAERQMELQRFVAEHDLECFRCGSKFNAWATAKETNGWPWALCLPCARKPREPQTTSNGSY